MERTGGGERHRVRRPVLDHRADRRPGRRRRGRRGCADCVEAAWAVFDRVAAAAPAELRKGPRGGGRDRDKMVGHVIERTWNYAREIGSRAPSSRIPSDRAASRPLRAAMLDVLRQPSDGSPLAGRKWTTALCRPPDRLARARPRLGDGGPDRAGIGGA